MRFKCGILAAALVFCSGITQAEQKFGPQAAEAEAELALSLTPNPDNGRKLFRICIVCHSPEGWGSDNGYYPQVAGQISSVTIKQLADIRARNRDNPTMFPFSMPSTLGGAQEMADVAAYIASLPMSPGNGVGPGFNLELGRRMYKEECAECHGETGEGDLKEHIPLIQGQHYNYLMLSEDVVAPTHIDVNAETILDFISHYDRIAAIELQEAFNLDRDAADNWLELLTNRGDVSAQKVGNGAFYALAPQSGFCNSEASGIRQLPGILVLGGGVTIQASGSMVGAVGVAGAPDGKADEKCAMAGVEAIQELLEFAD